MSNFNVLRDATVDQYAQRLQREGGIWVFHHIPKTAGSSLVQELRVVFPPYCNIAGMPVPEGIEERSDMMMAQVEAFLAAQATTQFRAVSGHLRLPHLRRIREALPQARVFTFLRDPVERVISEFRYTRTPKHPTYQDYLERYPTIEDFVTDPANQNRMWSFVAPRASTPDEDGLRRVFNRYAFIGTLENYADDFAFFAGLSGYPKAPSARQNVTKAQSDNAVDQTDTLHALIREHNQADIAFYDAVSAVLADRRADMQDYVAARRALFEGRADMPAAV